MARLLTSLGIMCGHESIFNCNGPQPLSAPTSYGSTHEKHQPVEEWFDPAARQAEASWLAVPYMHHEMVKNSTVIHLVREPMKVISSLICNDLQFFNFALEDYITPYRKFIMKHLPEVQEMRGPADRAAYFYIRWNEWITRSRPDAVLQRIEDQPEKVMELLSISRPENLYNNKAANRWKERKQDLTPDMIWDDGIRAEILKYKEKYGYTING